MHLVDMSTLLILLSLGPRYPIPGARISHQWALQQELDLDVMGLDLRGFFGGNGEARRWWTPVISWPNTGANVTWRGQRGRMTGGSTYKRDGEREAIQTVVVSWLVTLPHAKRE